MSIKRLVAPISWACERLEQEELLDQGIGTRRDVAQNMAEMQRINDLLGGTRALTAHLYPRLLVQTTPVTVVDLGTGGGGLPLVLVQWARKLNLNLRVLGVDWSVRNLESAVPSVRHAPEIHLLQANALNLPIPPGGVDFVISTLFMHHLAPETLVRVLREAYDLAQCGVIMSDLVRGWAPYYAFKLIAPVFARSYLTRHDGALSVRRAYTPQELYRLARRAGLPHPQVHTHFPWRMTLVVQKS